MDFEIKEEYLEKGFKASELLLYAYLKKYSDKNGEFNLQIEDAAKHTCLSNRTIYRAIRSLKSKGFVSERKTTKCV